jgi:uncharacterized integral membrane protein
MKASTRIVSWVVTAPLTLLVVDFAVSNREQVTLRLWPLPFDFPIMIWALTLIVLFVGFLLGAIVNWIADRRRRRAARLLAKRATELEQALAKAQARAAEFERKQAAA